MRVTPGLTVTWLAVWLAAAWNHHAAAADWPRFRGPNGSGVAADDVPPPVNWSPTENLRWKVPLPGEGVSSPVVVGDRVFVTTAVTVDGEPGLLDFRLVCLDRDTGREARPLAPQMRLVSLVKTDPLRIELPVPQERVGVVQRGQAVEIRVDAFPDRVFAGKVKRVASEAEFTPRNIQTRTDRDRLVYRVEVEVENADGALRPGMPVEVRLAKDAT